MHKPRTEIFCYFQSHAFTTCEHETNENNSRVLESENNEIKQLETRIISIDLNARKEPYSHALGLYGVHSPILHDYRVLFHLIIKACSHLCVVDIGECNWCRQGS